MNLPSAYATFLRTVNHYDIGEVDELISENSRIGAFVKLFFNRLIPACYILDYTRGKYIYATPRMRDLIEHPVSHFLDGGIEFATRLWHKKDLKIYSENVLVENLKFLKGMPVEEHSDYLFHCSYRGRRKNGGYRKVVQESIFIKSADNKMPLASLGFLYDVSEFSNDAKVGHRIMRINDRNTSVNYHTPIISNTYFSDEEAGLLTKREIEILKYVCDDMTSEEIARKLFISKHTVDNHRRSLLEKTNAKTSVGLVKYAIEKGYF